MQVSQKLQDYWRNRILLPTAIGFILLLIAAILVLYIGIYNAEKKGLEGISSTLALVVVDPILSGDHPELLKRIGAVGRNEQLSIELFDQNMEHLLSYPNELFSQNINQEKASRSIIANDGRHLGLIIVKKKFYLRGFSSGLIVLIAILFVILIWIWTPLRNIKLVMADILDLALSKNERERQISERKVRFYELDQTFNKIIQQQENLIKSEKSQLVAEIASHVSHDIRGPLAALEVLVNSVSFSSPKTLISINAALRRVTEVANDFLKISAGKNSSASKEEYLIGKPISINIAIEIERVGLEANSFWLAKKGILVEMEIDAKSQHVKVDPLKLQRILSNVIANAAEAHGTSIICLKLYAVDTSIIISVKDDGKGIPEDILKSLGCFGATFGKDHGTGLGLYFAKRTLSLWGGSLDIHSKLGSGTEVKITLPLNRQTKPEEECTIDAVIVDDDIWHREAWKIKGDNHRKSFLIFENILELLENLHLIDQNTPIFIDFELSEHIRGDSASWEIYSRGYKDIYICTAHEPSSLPPMPWVKEVLGKHPPDWLTK